MFTVKKSTSVDIPIFAHDANGDAVTGLLTAAWSAKRISKNSGAFADMTTTITELGAGWYTVGVTASHTDTAGILTCYFTHASCKQVNIQFRVETRLADDLAFPTTSGYSMDVTAAGNVAIDLDNASGTLAKGTEITGFNDLSSTSIAQAVWSAALTSYDGTGSFGAELQAHALSTEVPTAASIADAIFDEALSDHVSAGTAGLYVGQMSLVDASIASRSDFDVTSDQVIVTTVNDKTGYSFSSAGIAALLGTTIESTFTLSDFLKVMIAVLAGKSAGGGTTTLTFRDIADGLNRVTATVDANGNRTGMTWNVT